MIKNSDDANKYYSLVESQISDYLESYSKKFGVEPIKIAQHLLKNKNLLLEFISKRGLSEVSGINRVVQDILEDVVAFHRDSVMKFESFSLSDKVKSNRSLKDCLYLGLGEPTIEHEKLLADLFDCSLSHVECINSGKRIFRIDSESLESVTVFLESEFKIVYDNMVDYFINEMLSKDLNSNDISFGNLKGLVSEDILKERILDKFSSDKCKELICELLGGQMISHDRGVIVDL